VIAEHYARKWQAAGLIDPAAVQRILAWEVGHRRPVWLWAVAGMGALAMALGVMAIVGANWESISDGLKLGVDLALNALCAVAVFVAWRHGRIWPREVAALLLFSLVLSGIAVIGQVYQLQSAPWRALALWLALSTPFLALTALTRLTGILWALAAVTTWFMAADPVFHLLGRLGVLDQHRYTFDSAFFVPLQTYLAACGLVVIAAVRRLWPPARHQADQLLKLGIAGVIAACSLVAGFGFDGLARGDNAALGPIVVAAVATLVAGGAFWHGRTPAERRLAAVLLGVSFVVWTAALLTHGLERRTGEIAHALLFIVYWAILGAVAARAGWRGLFGLAFTVIGLRLLVLYFEAIGGLTATGLGLLGGGLLCLLLAAAGWRLTRRVPRRTTGAPS